MRAIVGNLHEIYGAELRELGVNLERIGSSEQGHPLLAYHIGTADLPVVSIVAGSHPDEPAGALAAIDLARRYDHSPILRQVQLHVVPQLDVDGVYAQTRWLQTYDEQVNTVLFLDQRMRRLPGEDREFAWPGAPWGGPVCPENLAADAFFSAAGPAIAHLSLHGMAVAEGAWFLLDRVGLQDPRLWQDLRAISDLAGLGLHDSPRFGDKGFRRCGRGFCTIPNGAAMRRWARKSQPRFQDGFAYSSMEAACLRAQKAGAAKPLCAVSEFPLLAIHKPGDGAWREAISSLPLAKEPELVWDAIAKTYAIQRVPLSVQVHAMVSMVEAVVASALRRQRQN